MISKVNKYQIIVFIGMLLVCQISTAQFYEVSRYADDSGLPSRIVRDIDQDPKGYIWVAGNNGLYQFDGHKFRAHYSKLKDSTGLRDNKINTVLAASDGKIWIATPKGLHTLENEEINYIPLKNKPNDKQNHIIELFEDSKQNIWVGTYGGLYVIEKNTNRIVNISEENELLDENTAIKGVTEDFNGNIWVCRALQVPIMAKKDTYSFQSLSITYENQLPEKEIQSFKYIPYNEQLFLIVSNLGILKATLNEDKNLTIDRFHDLNNNEIATDYAYNAIIDSEQNIWVATWRNQFKKYKVIDENLEEIEVISKNGFLNMSEQARSIFEDSQNNIWIPNSNGLYKLSENKGKIYVFPPSHINPCFEELYSIYGFTEDKGGHLWINTPSRLYRFNKQDILDKKCPTDFLVYDNKHFKLARTVFIDSKNRLWISGQEGLSIAQLDENYVPGEFVYISNHKDMPHKRTTEILEVNANTFWVGNYHRLLKITFSDNNINKPVIKAFNSSINRNDALVNSYTLNLAKDTNDQLWIGTFSGLSKLISEENEGVFENYTSEHGSYEKLSNNAIKKIFSDSKGNIWVGTQTGLNLYVEESNSFIQLGRNEGLPSEYILGIQEDSKGNLWLATTNGLMKGIYNESMKSFVHIEYFNAKDGLADNITNLNSFYIDADDNVFIGSAKGLSIFENTKKEIQEKAFNISLTTIESTQKKEQGFFSVKNKVKDQTLYLKHNENSIKLSYSVLDFTDPSFNSYRHKFLPTSEKWVETGNNSELIYYNLAPGTYTLILDGSNNQGIWAKNPIHLTLIISPPFWKSNLALFLYTLSILLLLRYFYLLNLRKKLRKLEIESKLEKAIVIEREQLRKENTADFHDELGSKVTKLSLFLTLAERSLKENKDPSQWFLKIRNNIKDLSGGFRDLLWVIDPQKDSLSDTFLRLKDFGEDLFNQTDVDFRAIGYSIDQLQIVLDPQTKKQVVLIFKEAMNNCAKYAESKKVRLQINSEEHFSSIELKDDGKGFNLESKSKGRGLKNMQDRSKKIGGILNVTSSSEGTVIQLLKIPHSRDDFQLKAM